MARYLVSTRRDKRGVAESALDAVKAEPGIATVSAEDPQMVTIEATEDVANRLRSKLRDTHFVEPEIRRSLE